MKKLIQILGIVVLAIVVILNIVYTADMNSGEQISINFNSLIYIIPQIIRAILINFKNLSLPRNRFRGRFSVVRIKRESGENPGQSRCCKLHKRVEQYCCHCSLK